MFLITLKYLIRRMERGHLIIHCEKMKMLKTTRVILFYILHKMRFLMELLLYAN